MMRLWWKFRGQSEEAPVNQDQAKQIQESRDRVVGTDDRKEAVCELTGQHRRAMVTGKELRKETKELSALLQNLLDRVKPEAE